MERDAHLVGSGHGREATNDPQVPGGGHRGAWCEPVRLCARRGSWCVRGTRVLVSRPAEQWCGHVRLPVVGGVERTDARCECPVHWGSPIVVDGATTDPGGRS